MSRSLPLLLILVSCGGKVTDGEESAQGTGGEGGVDAGVDAPSDGAHGDPCVTTTGVRLCGGDCLPEESCGSLGCKHVSVDGVVQDVGVCLGDLPVPLRSCWQCADGEVCADLSGEGLTCVEEDFCRSLSGVGMAAACRYADLAPYDGRPLAVATGAECPLESCGPGCSECEGNGICSGRSADFGYGFCVTTQFPEWCHGDVTGDCAEHCATWKTDTSIAVDYGWCASGSACDAWEASGRVDCHRN